MYIRTYVRTLRLQILASLCVHSPIQQPPPPSHCLPGCGGPTPHHLCGSTGTCSQTLKLLQYTSVQQLYILPAVPSDTSVPGIQNISTNSNGEAHYFTCSTSTCTHNHNTTNKEKQYNYTRTKETVTSPTYPPSYIYFT